EDDDLVADEPCVAIHRRRIQAPCIEVSLGARDEEASRLIERIEPIEVQITPIHDVEGAGLDEQQPSFIEFSGATQYLLGQGPGKGQHVTSQLLPFREVPALDIDSQNIG